jgi:DNA-directed RNA polymerase specialized sigma24 family protein
MNENAFPTTRWSLILTQDAPPERAARAAEEICHLYWMPVYHFIKGSGPSGRTREDAEDLTQGFFTALLSRDFLVNADPAKGRLRNYLLGAVKKHLLAANRGARAKKRGGGQQPLPLEEAPDSALTAEGLLPDEEFDRQWALCLLEQCLRQLRSEYQAAGKEPLYLALKPLLTASEPDDATSRLLNKSAGALRVALHRCRQRYHQILTEKVSETLLPGMDPAEEMAALAALLSRRRN